MNNNKFKNLMLIAACVGATMQAKAQSIIYPEHFDLSEVKLTAGPMRNAMKTNAELLLKYDADRLMTPFVREAKLNSGKYQNWTTEHPSFRNWGDYSWSLEGHIGGHYITALALAYAAMKDDPEYNNLAVKMLERMNYCLAIMKDCQDAYKGNKNGMEGFLGGQPYTEMWTGLYAGNLDAFKKFGGMVPFYCQHKILAGLRDAYVYAGSELAKEMYKALCDWSINVVSKLDEQQMQDILNWEHGGMNETLVDAYKIFGDKKYLDAAVKYSQKFFINGMLNKENGKYDPHFLDGKHANTQVPKFVGFERIKQLDPECLNTDHKNYEQSVLNFWDDVATNRTVCIGGNSVGEHFLSSDHCEGYITNLEGPESCNTNNMMKLSESLFDATHNEKYADFYESATWNHILSTQDPQTGGYVYFTTLRPQAYRIYSQVNSGMWCCVGTGMENHSKYAHFVYTHSGDTLFVNLFTPTELKNSRFALKQQTDFPYDQRTTLTITKGGKYTLAIRHPQWTSQNYSIKINGKNVTTGNKAGYEKITRKWKAGDYIEVMLPMDFRVENMPNYTDYVAFKVGPILLAAKTTAENEQEAIKTGLKYEKLQNEYADDSRMGHSPGAMGSKKSLSDAPVFIGNRDNLLTRLRAKDVSRHQYTIQPDNIGKSKWPLLTLQPFYEIQHARYSCYWYAQTPEEYAKSPMVKADSIAAALEARTIDFVATGEQQSEAGHVMEATAPNKGVWNSESYREIPANQEVSYTLTNLRSNNTKPLPTNNIAIMCRYTHHDKDRVCSIYIDDQPLVENWVTPYNHPSKDENGFMNIEYPIPESMLIDKDGNPKNSIRFRFKANDKWYAPSIFYLRLVETKNN